MPFVILAVTAVSFSFGFLLIGLRAASRADDVLESYLRPSPGLATVPVAVNSAERPSA